MTIPQVRKMDIESLEDRRLMAASIELNGGVIEIEGTNFDDVVQVQEQQFGQIQVTMTVNGAGQITKTFDPSQVNQIKFVGANGDDYFVNNTDISAIAYGQAGNDVLIGGSNKDFLFGGEDNDRLYGRDGNDTVFGEAGNDVLYGGNGADTMNGGSDRDAMFGQDGNDIMKGGSGNDQMYGGYGNDDMFGEAGNDNLYGQAGNDDMWGGTGTDTFRGGSGYDRAHDWFFEYTDSVESKRGGWFF